MQHELLDILKPAHFVSTREVQQALRCSTFIKTVPIDFSIFTKDFFEKVREYDNSNYQYELSNGDLMHAAFIEIFSNNILNHSLNRKKQSLTPQIKEFHKACLELLESYNVLINTSQADSLSANENQIENLEVYSLLGDIIFNKLIRVDDNIYQKTRFLDINKDGDDDYVYLKKYHLLSLKKSLNTVILNSTFDFSNMEYIDTISMMLINWDSFDTAQRIRMMSVVTGFIEPNANQDDLIEYMNYFKNTGSDSFKRDANLVISAYSLGMDIHDLNTLNTTIVTNIISSVADVCLPELK